MGRIKNETTLHKGNIQSRGSTPAGISCVASCFSFCCEVCKLKIKPSTNLLTFMRHIIFQPQCMDCKSIIVA